tara:strand:+ start:226 stop:1173 length:948 start_codon:yes stop_codon:yes gene_type:complete
MFKTPILILVYNRSKYLDRLISILRNIKAKNIYVSFDGPKKNQFDIIKCNNVKKEIEKINWKCHISKNYLKVNNGCKKGVSKGLKWFFSNVDRGIILEDDCQPNSDFFIFLEWALNKYKKNNKIGGITGNNFLKNKIHIKETYYYSKYAHCWGWATWKRTWLKYDKNIKFWKDFKSSKLWNKYIDNEIEKKYWEKIFNNVKNNSLDSWAYPWMLSIWRNNQMIITPKKNLVLNLGFSLEATHTNSTFHDFNYQSFKLKKPYSSPSEMEINKVADNFVFKNHYKGINYIWPYRIIYLLKYLFTDPISFFKKVFKLF